MPEEKDDGAMIRSVKSTDGAAKPCWQRFNEALHEPPPRREGRLNDLVNSKAFERITIAVIMINAVTIALNADYAMEHRYDSQEPIAWRGIEAFFAIFYLAELSLRMALHRCSFFICKGWQWNVLDCVVVGSSIPDFAQYFLQALTGNKGNLNVNMTFLRVLRLMKVVRILRVVRLMRAFFELRLILSSILGSVKALIWSLLLIFGLNYCVAIFFCQACAQFFETDGIPGEEKVELDVVRDILKYWGSVYKSMLSLYMATTGGKDWDDIAGCLKHVGEVYLFVFLFYIGFSFCVVTNTLTSLFVEATRVTAAADHELILHDALEHKQQYIAALKTWFSKIDADESGDVTLGELEGHLNDPDVLAFAKTLDIEILDVQQFFMMLSGKGSRAVDLDTFVGGCIRLKGLAKSLDLLDLMHTSKHLACQQHDELCKFEAFCRGEFDDIKRSLDAARTPAVNGQWAVVEVP